jgi:drug/metabolite transporter (DMT)-like permease
MIAALAALIAAFGYGTANLAGGLASRRQHAALTLLISQATAFPLVLLAALVVAGRPEGFLLGAAAGTLGFCGCACAYLCYSLGRPVGIGAVLLGTASAAVPVAIGVVSGSSRPGPATVAGLVIAASAVAVLGWPEETKTDTQAALLATVGGAMFGSYHVVMSRTPKGSGMWPLVGSQGTIVALAVVFAIALRLRHGRGRGPRGAALSVTDGVASTLATVAALVAVRTGSLTSTGMLIALAPAVTTLLAWVFVGERPVGRRAAGLALALAAIACLT